MTDTHDKHEAISESAMEDLCHRLALPLAALKQEVSTTAIIKTETTRRYLSSIKAGQAKTR